MTTLAMLVPVPLHAGDPAVVGEWKGPFCLPLLPIHSVHLHTNEILMWDNARNTAHLLDIADLDCIEDHPATDPADCNEPRIPASEFSCFEEVFNEERHTNEPDDGPDGHQTNMFCAGHAHLADGRIVVTGGHITFGNHMGRRDVNIFRPDEPLAEKWQAAPEDMVHRRWYPTHTLLADGRMLITTGSNRYCKDGPNDGAECRGHNDCGDNHGTCSESNVCEGGAHDGQACMNNDECLGVGTCDRIRMAEIPEIFDPETDTLSEYPQGTLALPFYPFNYVLPNGQVYFAGAEVRIGANVDISGRDTHLLDVEGGGAWVPGPKSHARGGSAIMFAPGKILKSGGDASDAASDNASKVTEIVDMTVNNPTWTQVADMKRSRTRHNLTILPNGQILATGGTERMSGANQDADGQLDPELYDFDDDEWTLMAPMEHPRMYHSEAILLPDGRVLSVGGGHGGEAETDYYTAEIFSPPYLHTDTPKPVITSAPESLRYGDVVEIQIGGIPTSAVERVTLHRLTATTHAFNQDQRYLVLPIVETTGSVLEVLVPLNARLAPPGHYMLFVVSDEGVPSIAEYVHIEPTLDKNATEKPTVIWVDFDYDGFLELGTFFFPFDTLAEGVAAVTPTGVVRMKGSSTPETPTITKPLTLETYSEPAVVGEP